MAGCTWRRTRVLFGAGLLLAVVFGVGWWVGRLGRREVANMPPAPWVVHIVHAKPGVPPYGGVDVRDRQIINFLDTLFPGYRSEVQGGPPATPSGEHYVPEFTLEKVGYAKRLRKGGICGNSSRWNGFLSRISSNIFFLPSQVVSATTASATAKKGQVSVRMCP